MEKPTTVKQLALGVLFYNGVSIIGPLLFFVVIGIMMDNFFQTKPIILIVCILLAFITTNILMFKKIRKLMKNFDNFDKNKKIN